MSTVYRHMLAVIIAGLVGCDGQLKGSDDAFKTGNKGSNNIGGKSDAEIAQSAMEAEAAEEAMSRSRSPSSKTEDREPIYVVQVGTYRVESNSQTVIKQLKAAGLPVVQKKIDRDSKTTLYSVRFEPTPSKAEAEKFVSRAKSLTGQDAIIITKSY